MEIAKLEKENLIFRWYPVLAAGMICFGVAIRLLGLGKGIWTDEYYSLKIIFSPDMFQALPLYDNQPPVYLMLLRAWSMISPREEFLRLLSVLLGVGGLVFLMLWMKKYSLTASLLAGLGYASLPILLRYSQELRSYPLIIFATAFCYYFVSRIIQRPEKSYQYVLLSLGLSLVAVSHLIGIMSVTSIGVFMLIALRDWSKIINRRMVLTFLLPAIVFFYIYFIVTPWIPDRTNWWMPPLSIALTFDMSKIVLGANSLLGLVQRSAANHLTLQNLIIAVIEITLIVWLLCLTLAGNWARSLPFAVAAIFYVLQVVMYSALVTPIFWYRTLLPALIPLVGFLGLQIATIKMQKIRWASAAIFILICLGFSVSWITAEANVPYEPWKQTSLLFQSNYKPGDLVIFYPPYTEGPFRYYATFLQADDIVLVELGASPETIKRNLENRAATLKQKGITPDVLLVVRADANVAKDSETYQSLQSYLANEYGPAVLAQDTGNIFVSKYHLLGSR